MAFPVVMYGCESWNIKRVEHQCIEAFQLWRWRWPLRFPWTARRSNQYILMEISPEYSLKGLMLQLKLQYFGQFMQRTDSLERTLLLQKIEAGGKGVDRGWDGWLASLTQWTWIWVYSRSWWWTGRPGVLLFMGLHSWTWLNDWTELKLVVSNVVSGLMMRVSKLHMHMSEM